MDHQPTIAVVILNWNGLELLKQFLPSVVEHSQVPGCTIYVADNASSDDSLAWVKATYGYAVAIIENDGNFGYAKGYNVALHDLKEDYFVLLNSDVEVTAQWLDPVIAAMESNPMLAACQPKLLSYRDKQLFEYAGAGGGYLDKLGYPFCRGRIFDSFETDEGQYDERTAIFWASGAALFIRAELFFAAGGFEEDFFAHMEEIDLCWRLHRMGYRIEVIPQSVIYHLGGGTLQKVNPRKTYLNFRNNRFMIIKNISRRRFIPNLIIRNLLDTAAALQALFYGNFRECGAILKALLDFHIRLPEWIRKRRKLRKAIESYRETTKKQPSTVSSFLYKRSIVYLYFLKGKKQFKDLP